MRHTCVRLSVLATSTALLLSCAVVTTTAHGAEPGLRDDVRGRAGQVIAQADEAHGEAPSAPPAGRGTAAREPAPREGRASGREAGDPPICEGGFSLTTANLGDRVVVTAYHQGAASLQVQRQRDYGTWRPVFTAAGEHAQRSDRDINTSTVFRYRLTARSAAGEVLLECVTYPLGPPDNDGRIRPDFVVATDSQLRREPFWSVGMNPTGVAGLHVTPAFSADGRFIAATAIDPATGGGRLVVRDAATDQERFVVDLGPDVSPADAAFSPDGQTLAFTRYSNQSGTSLGLGFADVHGSHAVRTHAATLPLAEPTWRADSSSLVASDLREDGGLVSTCATCTSATAIPATAGGYTPDIGPDGVLRFALTDETTSRIVRHTGSGVATLASGGPTELLSTPRTSPDGMLHYYVDDYATADDWWGVQGRVFSVDASGPAQALNGWFYGGYGFDVRQLATKDSSDVVGDAHHDVLTRDAAGVLWAYTGEGWGLGRRVRLGGGWNAFTRVLAAGDLTSDDRADLLATDSTGRLWLWKGTGRGTFTAKVQIGSGWSSSYALVAPGDLTGDQKADLVGRDASGTLWLWAGTGRGTVGTKTALGSGWNNQNAILGSGDADFDGRADLVSRDVRGRLWLWPGDGKGRLGAARLIGSGWGSFTALSVTGVTNQVAHVWARTPSGVLGYYDLHADGAFSPNGFYALGSGWNAMSVITS